MQGETALLWPSLLNLRASSSWWGRGTDSSTHQHTIPCLGGAWPSCPTSWCWTQCFASISKRSRSPALFKPVPNPLLHPVPYTQRHRAAPAQFMPHFWRAAEWPRGTRGLSGVQSTVCSVLPQTGCKLCLDGEVPGWGTGPREAKWARMLVLSPGYKNGRGSAASWNT